MTRAGSLLVFACSRRPFRYIDRVYDAAALEMNIRMLAAEFGVPQAETRELIAAAFAPEV